MSRGSQSGYDRHITIFSPEGKLYQVEYAFRAVKSRNITAIAIKGTEAACVVVQKKIPSRQAQQDTLLDVSSITSLYNITDDIGTAMIGLAGKFLYPLKPGQFLFLGDCRSIVFRARDAAVRFQYKMDHKIPVNYLCQKIANLHQLYTQHAYARLHACCGTIIAIDEETNTPVIYQFDPAGWFAGYHVRMIDTKRKNFVMLLILKACAAGSKEQEATNLLEKLLRNKQLKTEKEVVEEAIATLQSTLSMEFKASDIEVGVVSVSDTRFRRLDEGTVEQYLNSIAERD
ncbi:proteasome subunit alpha type-6-like isoform X1 [Hylaeus volcanicus]|uniref:proteasome subunit alpha type-6-like isoform X1 n=1 Tax=Hylaeus volcanicus TaxID=313075 RepID=UPI0023B83549|nr:proteasome subunit alpha type-6-like isoform X1 [Hylaeus volcanicus]